MERKVKLKKIVFYYFLKCVLLIYKALFCVSNNMFLLYLEKTQIKCVFPTFGKGYLYLAQTKSEQSKTKTAKIIDFQDVSVVHSETFAENPKIKCHEIGISIHYVSDTLLSTPYLSLTTCNYSATCYHYSVHKKETESERLNVLLSIIHQ